MKVTTINAKILQFKFTFHKKVKKELLEKINEAKVLDTHRCEDNTLISYCDWEERKDLDRPWFQLIKIPMSIHFSYAAKELGFHGHIIRDIWFQQYNKLDCHNWHIHSNNYTGVYYVENDSTCKTELYDSFTKKKFFINSKEGDLVFFPSFIVHRSPPKKTNKKKTIISWNVDFELIQQSLYNQLER